MPIITYLFLTFLFLIAAAIGSMITEIHCTKTFEKKENGKGFKMIPFVEKLLKKINCEYKLEISDNWYEYSFKYQNGNFIIICKENDNVVRIHYPHFFNTPVDNIDLVRETCNICNAHGFTHHVVYTTSGKLNSISLHITASIPVLNENEKYAEHLTDVLSHFFSLSQEFFTRYAKVKESYRQAGPYDIEKEMLINEREIFLLKEMELSHQDASKEVRASFVNPLSLSAVLHTFCGLTNYDLLELKVVTHDIKTVIIDEDIANFDISQVLVGPDRFGNPVCIGKNATLILSLLLNQDNKINEPQQITISLQEEGNSADSIYLRAVITMPANRSHQNIVTDHPTRNNYTLSFLFAFDKPSAEEKKKELRSEMQLLSEKIQQDDVTEFSDEEILIYKLRHPQIRDYYEHGKSLLRQKRYYEAVTELEFLYQYVSPLFSRFSQSQQNLFYELSYYIGLCYNKLALYKHAYYYLDTVFPLNNLRYMEAYVDCLVNGRDFRALQVIDNMEHLLKNQPYESEETIPENIKQFLNFLERRKAHFYMDIDAYDKAREIYKKMYENPETQDYALNELAYLQSITDKKHQQNDETSETSEADNKE